MPSNTHNSGNNGDRNASNNNNNNNSNNNNNNNDNNTGNNGRNENNNGNNNATSGGRSFLHIAVDYLRRFNTRASAQREAAVALNRSAAAQNAQAGPSSGRPRSSAPNTIVSEISGGPQRTVPRRQAARSAAPPPYPSSRPSGPGGANRIPDRQPGASSLRREHAFYGESDLPRAMRLNAAEPRAPSTPSSSRVDVRTSIEQWECGGAH
ncbi:hypothetical protein EVJ58_g6954 [Rhodofomes roseus]|uniref:Uncharacterized protein n=1 Tax=Rhodofomes roseus TaxID=34475 RepID=A0A4Y9Y9Q4_9APHY|nr:hypothetical protein EVJ58_g6954 [Rhodofomes roseus]